MNEELERIKRHLRNQERRRVPVGKSFAVLRWQLLIGYCKTEEDARAELATVPGKQRAGIADLNSGEIWSNKQDLPAVVAALGKGNIGPRRLERLGPIGYLKPVPKQ